MWKPRGGPRAADARRGREGAGPGGQWAVLPDFRRAPWPQLWTDALAPARGCRTPISSLPDAPRKKQWPCRVGAEPEDYTPRDPAPRGGCLSWGAAAGRNWRSRESSEAPGTLKGFYGTFLVEHVQEGARLDRAVAMWL